MIKTLLDVDPLSATKTWHYYDPNTDETFIETVQNVEPYLNRNKLLYNNPELRSKDKDMKHFASIPNGVQEKWLREYSVDVWNKDHWPAVKRLLNSPDWRYLRTAPGKL